MDGIPLHTFEDNIKFNQLEIGRNIHKDENAIELIVSSLSKLLKIERIIIIKNSAEIDDEGTNSMMSSFIAEQEKTIWILNLGKKINLIFSWSKY